VFDDPAVRSVRVALALCDRFAELLKGPTTVRAHKQRGALVGVSGDQEGLSMRIGEAQQLYPEIWTHLDEARTVFASRGTDVNAYDFLRDQEGTSLGANVDLHHKSHGYGSHGIDETVKSATFNVEGLTRARQACKALMTATPDIDWAAIAAAEGSDPAAADFARSTRNKRYLRLAALALVIFAPFGIVMYMRHQERVKMESYRHQYEPQPEPIADEDRDAIVKRVGELRPQITAARKGWYSAMEPAALSTLKPSTAPCALAIQAPPQAVADAFIRNNIADRAFASSDFYGYPADKPIPDSVLVDAQRLVDSIEKRIAGKTATHSDRDRLSTVEPYIKVVLIDSEVPAEITGTGDALTVTPGKLVGRAYVYSLRDAKIVCAGTVDARNVDPSPFREALGTRDGRDMLHREMEIRIRQALASSLHAL
jgi:hypothetical protein